MMRATCRLRDRAKMPEESFLARLVIIRRHNEGAIHAQLLGRDRGGDRFARGIRTGAGQHLAATAGDLDREPDDLLALIVRQGRAFAGRADGDDAGNARRDLALDQFLEGRGVNLTVAKWRNQGRESAAKHRVILPLEFDGSFEGEIGRAG